MTVSHSISFDAEFGSQRKSALNVKGKIKKKTLTKKVNVRKLSLIGAKIR